MNIFNLVSEIEKVDPEVYERLDERRAIFKHFAGFGKKLTAAALPLAMGSMFKKAYGQGAGLSSQVIEVLNFALTLEYLEAVFYNTGVNTPGLLTDQVRHDIILIATDENNHVKFLRTVLGAAARPALQLNDFDFTAKGTFPYVFQDRNTFLAIAQSLEDTGVRAYKGGAPLLMSNKIVLEAALDIHSVEARHASHLRTMRRGGPQSVAGSPQTAPKSWVSGNDNGGAVPGVTNAIYGPGSNPAMYPSEENIIQAGVNIATNSGVSASAASEAFDEPLDMATVLKIASVFLR